MISDPSRAAGYATADDAAARLRLHLQFQDGRQRTEVVRVPCTIGRDAGCDVRIRHWRVARVHARLDSVEAGALIEDLGSLAGTTVNGRRVARHAPLAPRDAIVIGPCLIRVEVLSAQADGAFDELVQAKPAAEFRRAVQDAVAHGRDGSAFAAANHLAAETNTACASDEWGAPGLIASPYRRGVDSRRAGARRTQQDSTGADRHVGGAASVAAAADAIDGATVAAWAASKDGAPARVGAFDPSGLQPASQSSATAMVECASPATLAAAAAAAGAATATATAAATGAATAAASLCRQRDELRHALLQALDLRRRDVANMSDAMLRAEAAGVLDGIVTGLPEAGRPAADLVRDVLDEAVGLGPLERLIEDAAVTEVMVNRYDQIYVERAGRLEPHDAVFSSEQSLLGVIEKIVTPLGRRIDESSPMVDARLPDGSRVHAIIAPVALKGAALTLRKFPQRRPTMQDLLAAGAFDARMADFLALCVRHRKNLVVAGGTGSGKTTLINVLSHCVPEGERIVTIEDAAELRLQHRHLIALEARPPNLEGKGGVSIRELVRNALRMRPDRIIVGECRGAEAFDMLAAMNTGHEGSLTSLHANNPRDALARLETMILMAGMSLPLQAVREHIASSIDLIVQQARLPSGRRLISAIVEVTGIESACIQLQEIYRYDRRDDVFRASGLVPDFVDLWREQGLACDMSLFGPEPSAGHTQALPGEAAAC